MQAALIRYIDAQNPDEVARQCDFLIKTAKTRLILTAISYGLAMMYLPFWFCFVLVHIDFIAEFSCMQLMKSLHPARRRWRYIGTHLCLVVGSVCYMMAAASIWQLEDAFARAFAVAMVAMAIVQLLTVRSIHLAHGWTGWTTLTASSLVGVLALWTAGGSGQVLVLSTLCVIAAAALVMSAMLSNHALHAGLVRGQAAARSADRAKGRFLAQMSHELRTPLNAILGMGEAELAGAETPDTHARMQVLVSSARGLAMILDDILDMSAIDSDHMPIRPLRADPVAEIAAIIALFQQNYHQAGLTLTVRYGEGFPAIALFDAQRLRQCVTNLLSNALKFTNKGGVRVQVDLMPDALLRMQVTDTGPGVPADVQKTIFQPFERGLTAQSGSGLGLSISRALARSMGGDLVLLPGAGGAAFCLTIKITALPDEMDRLGAIAPPELCAKRVLVVDDIATNRMVAASYLRRWGAMISEADGGADAVAQIAAHPPDLVLMDMNMPGLDGCATLALIRAMPAPAAQVPVIAMTADATVAHCAQHIAAGFNGFVAKPLTPESLTAAITAVLAAE